MKDEFVEQFRKYLCKCFYDQLKHIEECVRGPYFVNVRNTGERLKYVLEIEVEPSSEMCKDIYLNYNPGLFSKEKKKKEGVYIRDTGVKQGVAQTRILVGEELHKFTSTTFPEIVKRRQEKEDKHDLAIKSDHRIQSERLKRFIARSPSCGSHSDHLKTYRPSKRRH